MFYQLFRMKVMMSKEHKTNKKNGIGVINHIGHPERRMRDKHKRSLVSHTGEYYYHPMTWLLKK